MWTQLASKENSSLSIDVKIEEPYNLQHRTRESAAEDGGDQWC